MKKERIFKLSLLSLLVLPVLSSSCRTSDNPETFYKDVEDKIYYKITEQEGEDAFNVPFLNFVNYEGIFSEKEVRNYGSLRVDEKCIKNKYKEIHRITQSYNNGEFITINNFYLDEMTDYYYSMQQLGNKISYNLIRSEYYYTYYGLHYYRNDIKGLDNQSLSLREKVAALGKSRYVNYEVFATKDKSDYKARGSSDDGMSYFELYFDNDFINEIKWAESNILSDSHVKTVKFKKTKNFNSGLLEKIKRNIDVVNKFNFRHLNGNFNFKPIEENNFKSISINQIKEAVNTYNNNINKRTGIYKFISKENFSFLTTKALIDYDYNKIELERRPIQFISKQQINSININNNIDNVFEIHSSKSAKITTNPIKNYYSTPINLDETNEYSVEEYFYDDVNGIYKICHNSQKLSKLYSTRYTLYFTLNDLLGGRIFLSKYAKNVSFNFKMEKTNFFDEEFYNGCLETYKKVDFKENIGL